MTGTVLFRGGRVAMPTREPTPADVLVADGRFAQIGSPGSLSGTSIVDIDGLIMLPGAVDIHVHFRQPGLEYKEDFGTGTAAAACGGVTTVCDMPNTMPPVVDLERFLAKRELVSGNAYVDFGLWGGGTRLHQFRAMRDAGAIGIKVYMNRSHRPDDPYATELSMPDEETLLAVLARCAELDLLVAVHVSDHTDEAETRARLSALSKTDARLVCQSYRGAGVLVALRRVLALAQETGGRVHIAHASLAPVQAIGLVDEARRSAGRITCECSPPALVEQDLDALGVYGAPFAFPPDEAAFYWRALGDGRIDAVATDHAPHARADKEQGRDDVWAAPPGYPGVETSLALMIDAALRGVMPLARVVEVTSAAPARIPGLEAKGGIRQGADADFVLLDPAGSTVIDEASLHSKAGWSPFHGRTLRGRLTATYLRGTRIAADGDLIGAAPIGQMVRPTNGAAPITCRKERQRS